MWFGRPAPRNMPNGWSGAVSFEPADWSSGVEANYNTKQQGETTRGSHLPCRALWVARVQKVLPGAAVDRWRAAQARQ
eukprot:scaffold20011_cov33-Tisochrysis_lutea.AAC.8